MRIRRNFLSFILIFFSSGLFSSSPREEIIMKNLQAVGGKERLEEIYNLSIKIGDNIFISNREGKMKVLKGKNPAWVEVLVVDGFRVRKNSIKGMEDISGIDRILSIFQSMLFSGVFSLRGFGEGLQYNGIKSFGIKKFHEFEAKVDEGRIHLYIDSDDFLLKRAVINFLSPRKEKVEVNYDFGQYTEYNGLKIPFSWFVSRVGSRGILYEIEELKFNEKIEEGFFENMSINIGNVMVSKGELKGNIIDFYERQGRTFIVTNWTAECFEKAGIGTGDTVNFRVLGKDFEFNFFKDIEEARKAGASQRGNILSKAPDSEFYILFIPGTFDLKEKLQILLPIELRKK